jgi:hypothetical protein
MSVDKTKMAEAMRKAVEEQNKKMREAFKKKC